MTERERIIKEIMCMCIKCDAKDFAGTVADFILADRARIVEPLVEIRKNHPIATQGVFNGIEIIGKAIDETIKRANGGE